MHISSFTAFYDYSISIVKDNFFHSWSVQERKIGFIAIAALSYLTACYLAYRCCFKAKASEDLDALIEEANELPEKDKIDEVQALFEKAVNNEPQNPSTIIEYAKNLYSERKYDEAKTQFEKALTIEPQDLFALRGYAKTLGMLEQWDEAKT